MLPAATCRRHMHIALAEISLAPRLREMAGDAGIEQNGTLMGCTQLGSWIKVQPGGRAHV